MGRDISELNFGLRDEVGMLVGWLSVLVSCQSVCFVKVWLLLGMRWG